MALDMLHLVVGKTRTKKSIICATNSEGIEAARDHFNSPCFSADDLFDAFAVFSYLSIRSARKKNGPCRPLRGASSRNTQSIVARRLRGRKIAGWSLDGI
jgi:hypothetical protein